jgi:uncharacterized protein YjiS (DUF1127 family)
VWRGALSHPAIRPEAARKIKQFFWIGSVLLLIDPEAGIYRDSSECIQSLSSGGTDVTLTIALRNGLRASAHWVTRQYRQAESRRALAACSDRTLADIGMPREHIHLAARGVDVRDPIALSQAGVWPRLIVSIGRTYQRRREQLRVYRELMAYSDRELEEIGLRRRDIPAIARTA